MTFERHLKLFLCMVEKCARRMESRVMPGHLRKALARAQASAKR